MNPIFWLTNFTRLRIHPYFPYSHSGLGPLPIYTACMWVHSWVILCSKQAGLPQKKSLHCLWEQAALGILSYRQYGKDCTSCYSYCLAQSSKTNPTSCWPPKYPTDAFMPWSRASTMYSLCHAIIMSLWWVVTYLTLFQALETGKTQKMIILH